MVRAALLPACLVLAACSGPSTVYDPPPIWCYQSLAEPVCYAQPFARDRERLIGQYHPGPYAPVVSAPYPAEEAAPILPGR